MDYKKLDFSLYFSRSVGKTLKKSVSLQQHSNFRIGGKADYFFEATYIQELAASIRLAREQSFPYYIIGEGYNLLFDDEGFRGLIIKNSVKGIKVRERAGEIEIFSGTPLRDVIQFSIEEGLRCFEFLAGIPGTIGGAVFSNAGAFDKNIGSFLKEGLILDEKGEQVKVKKDYFRFNYRQSILKENHNVLLKAVFKLEEGVREKIRAKIEENLEKRRRRHPPAAAACAGSYFKNPVLPDGRRVPAAIFLEKVGAKNLRMGGAVVYAGHANFIINQEGASAKDVLRLAHELKHRVKEKFGLELQEEVIFLPSKSPAS